MNIHRSPAIAISRLLLALLCLPAFSGPVPAQPAQAGRWLFVFDTSPAMKKNLPATADAVNRLLATSALGQLQAGDSVGIWTYDRQLRAGQMPLLNWWPAQAAAISSNLVAFLEHQRYRDDSTLPVIQTLLPQVIANSERLTIIIFCDGKSDLRGTPYDAGVNQSFHDALADRKKNRQPFVVVVRTQLGKYVGCTLNYPPGGIALPPFPELPPPPTNTPAPPKVHPVIAPAAKVPPLVIIGTKVGTNLNAMPVVVPPSANANPAAPAAPVKATTNAMPAQPAALPAVSPPAKLEPVLPAPVSPPTNTAASSVTNAASMAAASVEPPAGRPPEAETVALPKTAPATDAGKADSSSRMLVWLGAGLLAAAMVLIVLLGARPGRRPQGSLISSSMQDDPRRK